MSGLHQIQSQADVHTFLLAAGVHPASVHVYAPTLQKEDINTADDIAAAKYFRQIMANRA